MNISYAQKRSVINIMTRLGLDEEDVTEFVDDLVRRLNNFTAPAPVYLAAEDAPLNGMFDSIKEKLVYHLGSEAIRSLMGLLLGGVAVVMLVEAGILTAAMASWLVAIALLILLLPHLIKRTKEVIDTIDSQLKETFHLI